MLYVVLILLIAAFGLLIATLIVGQTMLAWISVGVSALAALLLLIDALRRGRTRRLARQAPPPAKPATDPAPLDVDRAESDPFATDPYATDPFAPAEPADGRHARSGEDIDVPPAPDEPSVEPTPDADLPLLAELDDEVVVVDERPRYHLTSCAWLGERAVIPLPIYEARELGFTPCAVCTPDTELLAQPARPASPEL